MEIMRDASAAERGQPRPPPSPLEDPTSTRPTCLGNWKRWIRPAFYAAYGLVVLAAIPLIILDVVHAEQRSFQITLAGVGFFAMVISIPISVWGIINHIVCFTRPDLQKYIIRILWMIPVFELNCWFAMRFPVTEIYLDTLRQLYQAYVIYNFVFYLLAFFEEVPDFQNRLIMKPQIKSPPPCCCIKAVPNQRIINRCKTGVLNYTVIRIVFSIVSIITDLTGTFFEGNYSPKFAYLWVTIILTISQIWAIFCMVLLRKATLEELKMLPRSTAQFVGIQMVIFVTNFQSIFLNLLAHVGVLKPKPEWGYEDVYAFATMLQDFLICLEMVVGAAFFSYSFDYQRYNTDTEHRMILSKSFKQMWNVSDVKSDIMAHLRLGGHSSTSQQSSGLVDAEQPPAVRADSPASLQTVDQPREDVAAPRRKKPVRQLITLPDIILNHQEDSDHADEIQSAANQNGEDGDRKLYGENQDDGHQSADYESRKSEGQYARDDTNPSDDGFKDDASGDTDDLIDNEFPTDDDDDNSDGGHLPIDPRLDAAPRATNSLGVPLEERRVRKVSYTGVTFEDMDWDHIKSHRSPTMDSEFAVATETEKDKTAGEGFGSSEA